MSSLFPNFLEQLFVGRGVEIQDGKRGAAGLISAKRHGGDVHAMFAEQGSDSTDHAGAIGIFQHEHDTLRACFHRSGVDANDSWSRSKKCAADGYIFPFGAGRKLQHVGVIPGRAQPRLGDFQSQTFGEGGRVYFIDFASTGALQETFEHGASDRGGIDFVYFSAVIDVEPIDSSRRKLREEAAEFLAKTQMRPNDSERFRVEVRHVDGVADRPFEQGRANRLRDFDADAFLRFGGRSAEMRRQNKIRHFAQRRIGRQRFRFENIERRAGDVTAR